MGYRAIKHLEANGYNRILYYLDDGPQDLPPITDMNSIQPGSEARVLNGIDKYILNTRYEWVLIPGAEPEVVDVPLYPADEVWSRKTGGWVPSVSADTGNAAVKGSDGGIFVTPGSVSISTDADNIITTGTDGGLYAADSGGGAPISTDPDNIITTGTDGGIFAPPTEPADLISNDANNGLGLGNDNKLFATGGVKDITDGANISSIVIKGVADIGYKGNKIDFEDDFILVENIEYDAGMNNWRILEDIPNLTLGSYIGLVIGPDSPKIFGLAQLPIIDINDNVYQMRFDRPPVIENIRYAFNGVRQGWVLATGALNGNIFNVAMIDPKVTDFKDAEAFVGDGKQYAIKDGKWAEIVADEYIGVVEKYHYTKEYGIAFKGNTLGKYEVYLADTSNGEIAKVSNSYPGVGNTMYVIDYPYKDFNIIATTELGLTQGDVYDTSKVIKVITHDIVMDVVNDQGDSVVDDDYVVRLPAPVDISDKANLEHTTRPGATDYCDVAVLNNIFLAGTMFHLVDANAINTSSTLEFDNGDTITFNDNANPKYAYYYENSSGQTYDLAYSDYMLLTDTSVTVPIVGNGVDSSAVRFQLPPIPVIYDVSDKVTKERDRDLSTNDFTDAAKALLESAVQDVQDSLGNSLVSGNVATIPEYPDVPVQGVTVDGVDVVDANGIAQVTIPVKDINDPTGASIVDPTSGVAKIPVMDVTYSGATVLSNGVAAIPAPPVSDVWINGSSVIDGTTKIADIVLPDFDDYVGCISVSSTEHIFAIKGDTTVKYAMYLMSVNSRVLSGSTPSYTAAADYTIYSVATPTIDTQKIIITSQLNLNTNDLIDLTQIKKIILNENITTVAPAVTSTTGQIADAKGTYDAISAVSAAQNGYVKLSSATPQTIDSDLVLSKEKSLYGIDQGGDDIILARYYDSPSAESVQIGDPKAALELRWDALGLDGSPQTYGDRLPVTFFNTTGNAVKDSLVLYDEDFTPLKTVVDSLVMGGVKIGSFATFADVPTTLTDAAWVKTPSENDFFIVQSDANYGNARTQYYVKGVDVANDTLTIAFDGAFDSSIPTIKLANFQYTTLRSEIPAGGEPNLIYWDASTSGAPSNTAGSGIAIRSNANVFTILASAGNTTAAVYSVQFTANADGTTIPVWGSPLLKPTSGTLAGHGISDGAISDDQLAYRAANEAQSLRGEDVYDFEDLVSILKQPKFPSAQASTIARFNPDTEHRPPGMSDTSAGIIVASWQSSAYNGNFDGVLMWVTETIEMDGSLSAAFSPKSWVGTIDTGSGSNAVTWLQATADFSKTWLRLEFPDNEYFDQIYARIFAATKLQHADTVNFVTKGRGLGLPNVNLDHLVFADLSGDGTAFSFIAIDTSTAFIYRSTNYASASSKPTWVNIADNATKINTSALLADVWYASVAPGVPNVGDSTIYRYAGSATGAPTADPGMVMATRWASNDISLIAFDIKANVYQARVLSSAMTPTWTTNPAPKGIPVVTFNAGDFYTGIIAALRASTDIAAGRTVQFQVVGSGLGLEETSEIYLVRAYLHANNVDLFFNATSFSSGETVYAHWYGTSNANTGIFNPNATTAKPVWYSKQKLIMNGTTSVIRVGKLRTGSNPDLEVAVRGTNNGLVASAQVVNAVIRYRCTANPLTSLPLDQSQITISVNDPSKNIGASIDLATGDCYITNSTGGLLPSYSRLLIESCYSMNNVGSIFNPEPVYAVPSTLSTTVVGADLNVNRLMVPVVAAGLGFPDLQGYVPNIGDSTIFRYGPSATANPTSDQGTGIVMRATATTVNIILFNHVNAAAWMAYNVSDNAPNWTSLTNYTYPYIRFNATDYFTQINQKLIAATGHAANTYVKFQALDSELGIPGAAGEILDVSVFKNSGGTALFFVATGFTSGKTFFSNAYSSTSAKPTWRGDNLIPRLVLAASDYYDQIKSKIVALTGQQNLSTVIVQCLGAYLGLPNDDTYFLTAYLNAAGTGYYMTAVSCATGLSFVCAGPYSSTTAKPVWTNPNAVPAYDLSAGLKAITGW